MGTAFFLPPSSCLAALSWELSVGVVGSAPADIVWENKL